MRVQALARVLWTRWTSDKRVIMGDSQDTPQRLRQLVDMVDAGELRPVLDRSYALAEVAEAHRYVERGHKQGNVVLTVVPRSVGEGHDGWPGPRAPGRGHPV